MTRQDYGTPLCFIDAVVKRFGSLECDLAASFKNRKAAECYTIEDDSLKQSWAEDYPTGNLWLNPPFTNIAPWAEKCTDESSRRHGLILLLTPASIGANWFAEHVHHKAMVLGLSPRLTFEGETAPYPKDCMLSVYGLGFSGFDVWRWK